MKTTFSNGHKRINYRRQVENMFHIFKCDIRHKQIDNYGTMLSCSRITDGRSWHVDVDVNVGGTATAISTSTAN